MSTDDVLAGLLRQANSRALADVVRVVLGGVLNVDVDRQTRLLETWRAVRSTPTQRAAARRLDIQPRTVRARLSRLAKLTGLDLRKPSDRYLLDLAFDALRVLRRRDS